MGSTRKILIFIVVVLGLVLASPYFVPLNLFFSNDIERSLTQKLKRKVSVGDLGFAYQPYPTLLLNNVQIGSGAQDGSAHSVELQLDLLTVLSEQKRLRKFVINEASLDLDFIRQIPDLLKPDSATKSYFVREIEMHKITVRTPSRQYGPLDAEVFLNPDQSFKQVLVHNPQRSVELDVRPNKEHFAVSVMAKNWEAAKKGDQALVIESLVLEAETHGNTLIAHEIKGDFARGRFKGSAVLDWNQGWSLTGNLELTSMDGETATSWFNPATNLTGRLNGNADVALNSASFDDLAESPIVKAEFNSTGGTLNNFDFISPVRRNIGPEGVRGGSTKYDRLSGSLSYRKGHISLSKIQLKSGLLAVNANMNVVGQKLSGNANVTLGQGANHRSVPMRITGEFDKPHLIPLRAGNAPSSVTVITE